MNRTIEIIAEITSEKIKNNRYPTHATHIEVMRRNKESVIELKELEQAGKIKYGRTINDRYIIVL